MSDLEIELNALPAPPNKSSPYVPPPMPADALPGVSTAPSPSLRDGKSNIPSAVSNFLNSIVGAGIIGIPFAIRHCGLLTGVLLLTWVGYLTDCSVRMIVTLGRDLGVNDYERLAEKIYGKRGYTLICAFMIFLAFGAMVAYCIVVGDVVPELLGVTSSPAARPVSILLCR
jgi:solute carrier family 38 (sodium-coupled neutral amino acid transporter), member 11